MAEPVPTAPAEVAPVAVTAASSTAVAFVDAGVDPRRGLSVLSMVLGILGLILAFVAVGGVFSLVAVVLGHIAAVKQPGRRGFWLTGLITGYLGIVVSIIVVIVAAILGAAATLFFQIL